ncbi:MAG: DUF2628 domain-containing protein [Rhodospirillaceae bacterium]|jgi:hypothetical protein|nr:DUF2628 domain-containing protein [Rhodospirillaceae bacterium]MBT3925586.1 DUF2628 domain-containing protein [Rhodospirillaceae bacterium]MBT4427280.1 DUF2628 domain-containing protein [Rhodospirillaceae bacterium]MBT5039719.1 DUF2628 domain-containing protein [Rhodospirillaceae bacterium]MBT5676816.1 DUF2628 domain-containing protein [Rhodospirillaceae bacterium]
MRYYTVHLPRGLSQGGDPRSSAGQMLGGALFVREGFCWGALFFSILWAIGHGMWLGALAMAALLTLVVGLPEIFALDWASRAVLLIGYLLVCGFNGNDWRRLGLKEGGWDLVSVIAARDSDHAVMRLARLLGRSEESEPAARPAAAAPQAQTAPRLDVGPSPGFWS